jgi:hypothetical protein
MPLRDSKAGNVSSSSVSAMQPEETFAFKLFTYTNRTFGFTRKTKDLSDMAAMVNHGLDENKVSQALQAWTTRGYSLGPMRHPTELYGRLLERHMAGQTTEQLDANFGAVRNFYAKVAPTAESQPLRPEVRTNRISQLTRFLEKQYIVYPAG